MSKYEIRYYWNLKEILARNKEDYQVNSEDLRTLLVSLIQAGFQTSVLDNEYDWTNDNYPKVLDLVIRRHITDYCVVSDSEAYPATPAKNFLAKLIYVLEMTTPRYTTLINSYEESRENLLNPVIIKTTGINRFNDTPQDEGDFANDSHTTNLTEIENKTENDADTAMGRIREIEENYKNLLLIWSREFESLFLSEDNL